VKIVIYVEGGGEKKDAKDLKAECRRGFQKFFEKAGLSGALPKVVACGSREQAFRSFQIAVAQAEHNSLPILLVDSEGPITEPQSLWAYLAERDGWRKPQIVSEDQAHLMVQCMESWFFADQPLLARYFGKGFQNGVLATRADIENIAKTDLFTQLAHATRNCQKQPYSKGKHSFALLAEVDPQSVIRCSPFAKRLIDTLKARAGE